MKKIKVPLVDGRTTEIDLSALDERIPVLSNIVVETNEGVYTIPVAGTGIRFAPPYYDYYYGENAEYMYGTWDIDLVDETEISPTSDEA